MNFNASNVSDLLSVHFYACYCLQEKASGRGGGATDEDLPVAGHDQKQGNNNCVIVCVKVL